MCFVFNSPRWLLSRLDVPFPLIIQALCDRFGCAHRNHASICCFGLVFILENEQTFLHVPDISAHAVKWRRETHYRIFGPVLSPECHGLNQSLLGNNCSCGSQSGQEPDHKYQIYLRLRFFFTPDSCPSPRDAALDILYFIWGIIAADGFQNVLFNTRQKWCRLPWHGCDDHLQCQNKASN